MERLGRILGLSWGILTAGMAWAQTPQAPQVTPSTLPTSALPTYVMAGGSYNQYTGWSGFVSGIMPEASGAGIYGSVTIDVVPVRSTDPKTGKMVWLLSLSARGGQHKTLWRGEKTSILLGGDLGASFSGANPQPGVNVGVSGSFTLTFVRMIGDHWGIGIPVRMLWISGTNGGSGAWNPVVELGLLWKP